MKSVHLVQPYRVGSKQGESLAIIIPSQLRKQADITSSTIFMLKFDEKNQKITLNKIDELLEKYENTIPAAESLAATKQQVSSVVQ